VKKYNFYVYKVSQGSSHLYNITSLRTVQVFLFWNFLFSVRLYVLIYKHLASIFIPTPGKSVC